MQVFVFPHLKSEKNLSADLKLPPQPNDQAHSWELRLGWVGRLGKKKATVYSS